MRKQVLITGGAGFIGTNVARRLLEAGDDVMLLDNLSRGSVRRNADWLKATYGARVDVRVCDVRDASAVKDAVARASRVFHLAAQVAVTTSLADPVDDFEVNARGTLNVLEAIRATADPPPLLFTSTNKVYGGLEDVALVRDADRYMPERADLRAHGISEARPLSFHSPYGCSKGTADQYVIDYARSFGLPAVVFRMSCIYGPRQFGNEDQGWLAHFAIRAREREPITLYGDGRQVRDVLFVEDLVDAMLLAHRHIDELSGRAFNIGGGPTNTTSLLEALAIVAEVEGVRPVLRHGDWRTGDQRYYVSDHRAFSRATGWAPRVGLREGMRKLHAWCLDAGSREVTACA